MGWSFPCQPCSKAETIARRTRTETHLLDDGAEYRRECLRHACVGNTLWTVWHITARKDGQVVRDEKYIGCDLLALEREYRSWGYKDMCESMHPYLYNCPLPYLDEVPVACAEWREGVRSWHARRAGSLTLAKSVVPGAVVRLPSSFRPSEFRVVAVSPRRILGSPLSDARHAVYRIPRTKIVSVTQPADVIQEATL